MPTNYKDIFPGIDIDPKKSVLNAAARPIPSGQPRSVLSRTSNAFKQVGGAFKAKADTLDSVIKSDTAQVLGNYSDAALRTVSSGLANSVYGKPGTGVLQEGNLSNTAKAWARGVGTGAGYGLQAYGGAMAAGALTKGLQAGGAAMQAVQGASAGAKALRGAGAVTSFAGAHPAITGMAASLAVDKTVPAEYRGYVAPAVNLMGFNRNPMMIPLNSGVLWTYGQGRAQEEQADATRSDAVSAAQQDASRLAQPAPVQPAQPGQPPQTPQTPQTPQQPAIPPGQLSQQRLSQWQQELKGYENDPDAYRQQYEARAVPYLVNAGEFNQEMFGMLSPAAQQKVLTERTSANIKKNQGIVGGAVQWGKDKLGYGADQAVLEQAQREDKVLNDATGQYIVNTVASGGASGKMDPTHLNTLKAFAATKSPEELKALFQGPAMKGMSINAAISLAKGGNAEGLPPELTEAIKSGVQSNAWNWIKENPLENIPKVVGLWMHGKGWNTAGDWSSNPWVFYGSLAALLVGGSMLMSGGGDEEEQRQWAPMGAYTRPDDWAEAMYGR